jgi:hypothetical protein
MRTPVSFKVALAAGVFVFGVSLASLSASAAIITYNSRAAWTAAVTSPSTVDFDVFTGNTTANLGSSYSEGGVNFAAPQQGQVIFGLGPTSNNFPAGTFYGSGYLEWQGGNLGNTLFVTLPSAVDAIGFDYAELFGSTIAIDVFTIVADGQTFTALTSTSGALFFGLTDTNTFTSFTITDENLTGCNCFPTIDNVSFAPSASAVPEPSTLGLIGLGLLGLGAMRRRRSYS